MALLTLDHVSFGYENIAVVKNLSFTVNTGDYLVIVGENGSGKTTLVRGMLGLIRPYKGSITMGDDLRKNQIGYMPQQTAAQKSFPASVEEVVISGCLNRCGWKPFFGKNEIKRARDAMEQLGLSEYAKSCYRDLSGGQQQRVFLARALCATEKLLLLDEPTAGLDPVASHELYEQIYALNQTGVAIVMVSHDVTAGLKNASAVLCMHHNADAFYGTVEEYMSSDCGRFWKEGLEDDCHD